MAELSPSEPPQRFLSPPKGAQPRSPRPWRAALRRGLRGLAAPLAGFEAARGQLLPLGVASLAVGIGLWFAAPTDPPAWSCALAFLIGLAGFALQLRAAGGAALAGAIVFAVCLGFSISGWRAAQVAAPVLNFRYYGAIEGRVIAIDRSASDALRLTLDQVVLERMGPERLPRKVRISLQADNPWHEPKPGERLILTGLLAPPEGPAEPGGFDFRRMAWFEALGAVGYSRTPVLLLEPARGYDQVIGRLRHWFSEGIRAAIPGEAGAFAAGAMTGDRSGISQETVIALRDSSLAHLLAISGMNLAFLTGFVFGLIRGAVALWPWLALRLNAKKVAAAVSLPVSLFYLLLSGSNVATERAFIMSFVMLVAVLADRRALSMRSAAQAAAIILLMRPESLVQPGFQMSVAATVALIAGFRGFDWLLREGYLSRKLMPKWALPLVMLCLSSLIGGIATAPYAAAHFNRFAAYGFAANLLTVPVMGAAVMPMGVLAFLLAPFGLAFLPLYVMGLAAAWILWVAAAVASLQGAVSAIVAPHPWSLPLISLAGVWLIAWPGRARVLSLPVLAFALALWPSAPRPELLIASDGRLLGLNGPGGRALSSASAAKFAAESWLENDGDLSGRVEAARRPGFEGAKGAQIFRFSGGEGVLLSGKRAAAALPEACARYALVVYAGLAAEAGEDLSADCPLIDLQILRRTGALAYYTGESSFRRAQRPRVWAPPWQEVTLPEIRQKPQ